METIKFLFYYITPYVAVGVFFVEIAYQLYRWRQKSPVPSHLSLYPRPESGAGRVVDMLIDMFTLKGLFRVNKPLWAGGLIMHLGLLAPGWAHPRRYRLLFPLGSLNWGESRTHVPPVAGTIAGILFTSRSFTCSARRWSGAVKWLSIPEDFIVLVPPDRDRPDRETTCAFC